MTIEEELDELGRDGYHIICISDSGIAIEHFKEEICTRTNCLTHGIWTETVDSAAKWCSEHNLGYYSSIIAVNPDGDTIVVMWGHTSAEITDIYKEKLTPLSELVNKIRDKEVKSHLNMLIVSSILANKQ